MNKLTPSLHTFTFLLAFLTVSLFIPSTVFAIDKCSTLGIYIQPEKKVYANNESVTFTIIAKRDGAFLNERVHYNLGYQIQTFGSEKANWLDTRGNTNFFHFEPGSTQVQWQERLNPKEYPGAEGLIIGQHYTFLYEQGTSVGPGGDVPVCIGPVFEVIPSQLKDTSCSFSIPKNLKYKDSYTVTDLQIPNKDTDGLVYQAWLYEGTIPTSAFRLGKHASFFEGIAGEADDLAIAAGAGAALGGGLPGALIGVGFEAAVSALGTAWDISNDSSRLAKVNGEQHLSFDGKSTPPKLTINSNKNLTPNRYTLAIVAKLHDSVINLRSNYGFACGVAPFEVSSEETSLNTLVQSVAGKGAGLDYSDARNASAEEGTGLKKCDADNKDPDCSKSTGQTCNPQTGKIEEGAEGIMTALGCIPIEPSLLIAAFLRFSASVGGGIALLLMIFGGFRMITSQGNPETIKKGRDQFSSAVIGLLFIIFSVLLLQFIGVDILSLPGFTK